MLGSFFAHVPYGRTCNKSHSFDYLGDSAFFVGYGFVNAGLFAVDDCDVHDERLNWIA